MHQIHRLPFRPASVFVQKENFAGEALIKQSVGRGTAHISGSDNADGASLNHRVERMQEKANEDVALSEPRHETDRQEKPEHNH